MSADRAAAPVRLPLIASVLQTYGNVLGRPHRLFVVAAVPAALCVILSGAFLWTPWQTQPLAVLYFLVLLIPMSYLGLKWTHQTQRGEQPQCPHDQPGTAAYAKVLACFVFWAFSLYLWPIIPITIGILLAYGLVGQQEALSAVLPYVPIVWLCLAVFGVIPFARLFLALPLIAKSQPASPLAAWKAGAGAGLRLGVAVVLLTVTLIMLAVLGLMALTELVILLMASTIIDIALHDTYYLRYHIQFFLLIWIVLPIASVLGTVLFAELLATAFRTIAGWSGPRGKFLERFD